MEEEADEQCDALVQQAYAYVTDKTYPSGCSETRRRVIRKKATKFELKDGELYYKQKQKGKVSSMTCCSHIKFACTVR